MVYRHLIKLLTQENLSQSLALFLMILLMATLDMLGVASIFPFIAVLSDPTIIDTNVVLRNIYNDLGFDEKN